MADIDDVLAQYSKRQAFEDDEARQTLEAMRGPTPTRAKAGDTVDRGYILPYARSVQDPYKGPWNSASTSDILKHLDVNPDGKTADRWAVPGILKDIWDSATTVGGSASLENKPYLRPSQMSEEDIEQYLATAGAGTSAAILGGLGRLGLGPRTPGGELGTFGGRLAKTADHEALARAEAKAAQGVPREQIWADEGWFQGPDGKWRFEIDDSGSSFNKDAMTTQRGRSFDYLLGTGQNTLPHQALYDAYPQLAEVPIVQGRSQGAFKGQFSGGFEPGRISPSIALDFDQLPTSKDMRSTGLHEYQHGIQSIEDTARGGNNSSGPVANPDLALFDAALKNDPRLKEYMSLRDGPEYAKELADHNARYLAEFQPRLDALDEAKMAIRREGGRGDPRIGEINKQIEELFKESTAAQGPTMARADALDRALRDEGIPRWKPPETISGGDVYQRLTGEVEARAVQKRQDMTPEERRARAPWLDYDIPESRQVVRLDNSGPSASIDDTLRQYSKGEPEGFTVYHGSPHDFDRFDLSKIGTGEGAQAYGHGLYFAEGEGVARSYRDALAGGFKIDGRPFNASTTKGGSAEVGNYAADALSRFKGDKDAAIAWLQEGGGPFEVKAAQLLKDARQVEPWNGHMYEARIKANPEDFLDWDKPLAQQSDKVRAAWDTFLASKAGKKYAAELGNASNLREHKFGGELRGQDLLSNVMGAHEAKPNYSQMASDFYRKQGIPGIKYLDQGSRGAGEGSRNYVVFDDKLIQMVRKYGWAAAMAMAAASASGTGSAEAGSIDDVLSRYNPPRGDFE